MNVESDQQSPKHVPEHWWTWDAANRRFRHRLSGEELRYSGPVELPDGPKGRQWHRFDYVHDIDHVRYPLLVFTKMQSFPLRPNGIDLVERPLTIWRLDHLKSAELWRLEQQTSTPTPPYGLWRRADDAFWNATLQYRPISVFDAPVDMIAINGGWWNGEWRQSFFRRYFSARISFARNDTDSYDPRHDWRGDPLFHPIQECVLPRLDATPPRWRPAEAEVCTYQKRWPPKRYFGRRTCLMDEATGAILHDFEVSGDERLDDDRFPSGSRIWLFQLPGCSIHIWSTFERDRQGGPDFLALKKRIFLFLTRPWWDKEFAFQDVDPATLAAVIERQFVMPGIKNIEAALADSWERSSQEAPAFHPAYRLWSDMIRDAVPNLTPHVVGDTSAHATRLWQAGTLRWTVMIGSIDRFWSNLRLTLEVQDDPEGDDWPKLFADDA